MLLQPTATQQVPNRLDTAAPKSQYSIVKHKSKIAITRNNMHFFSNFQIRRPVEGNRCMFGGESDDPTACVVSEDGRSLVLADGLLTDVQNCPIGIGSADDGGQH